MSPSLSLAGANESDQDDDHTSAEAGGIVRGAARTATTISRRSVLGRLPKVSPKAPIVLKIPKGKMSMPNIMPKRVPVKHVARISDRISTGFDAYDAATSSSASTLNEEKIKEQSRLKWKKLRQRIITFSGSEFILLLFSPTIFNWIALVKNTIMGAAVFETYEQTIQFFDKATTNNHTHENFGTDAFERIGVSQHFAAGALAGSAHSILHIAFESANYAQNRKHRFQLQHLHLPVNTSLNAISSWSICHTIHHALAHALLFSTYEGTKRLLFGDASVHLRVASPFRQQHTNADSDRETTSLDEQDYKEHTIRDILLVTLSGGIAGQIQHVASHFTESWLRVGDDHSVRRHWERRHKLFANVKLIGAGPSMRSTVMAFPPSAIGFVAFEFGKGLIET